MALNKYKDKIWKELFRNSKPKTLWELAEDLVQKFHVKTLGSKRLREIFIYCNGVYLSGENLLRSEIQAELEDLASTHVKNEIIEKIKDLTPTDRKAFEVDPRYLNLNNGILDVFTGELLPHSPDYLFMHQLPCSFDSSADCPRIKQFLSEILQEEDMPVIQEWFGYSLYRRYYIKKAVILVGERDTGKSTLLKLFDRLLGKENISGVSLQRLAQDKFSIAHLYNKHINIFDDLSYKDVNDNGAFKIATGGGIVTGEFKFGDQFQFENYSKLTFSCNKIPDVKDAEDEAYFGRWIVIQFNKTVTRPDKFLMDKMSTAEEISGLLNFALEGLKRLLEKQEFSYQKSPDEIKAEMMRSGSVVANFVYDCLEQADGEWISKDKMYEAFAIYAQGNKLPLITNIEFGRKLPKFATYVVDSKGTVIDPITIKRKQDTGWRNVRLRSGNDESDESYAAREDVGDEMQAIIDSIPF